MKTGFVGLGAMGVLMARNLHHAGLLHAVWNRTHAKAAALAGQTRCLASESLADLAARCECVVICVTADAEVLSVVEALTPALADGAIVIDCSTVRAETARRAADMLATAGAHFLDCPVTGGTEGARAGTLSILCGGEIAIFERAGPVLQAMGGCVVHMGPVGAGQAAKAVNQIMVAGINQAVSEAMAFARAEGLAFDVLIEALGQGAAGSWFLSNRAPNMQRGEYPLGFKVALHQKDLEICREMAAAHSVALPLVEMTLLHYRRLLAQGHEDEDISSLYRLKAAMFDAAPD